MSEEFYVNLKKKVDNSYKIIITDEKITEFSQKIREQIGDRNFLIVISNKVNRLYGKVLGFSREEKFVLKDGENQKNLKTYEKIIKKAELRGLTRKDVLIAIGGGVVGDITGFAASTYMRGINFIQIPTTLLAAVDSSVGGKVGVNNKKNKNFIGAFWQPEIVLINLNFLKTLDKKQFRSGMGEVIKYALIEKSSQAGDFGLLDFLSANADKINLENLNFLEKIIKICILLKISVIEKDEKEQNLRKILNLGHTYGHAVEEITHYKKFAHGEAVILGIMFAFQKSLQRGIIPQTYLDYVSRLVTKLGFTVVEEFDEEKMIELMHHDKKAHDNKIVFILPTKKAVVEEFDDVY